MKNKTLSIALLSLAGLLVPAVARADGVLVAKSALDAKARTKLEKDVAAVKASNAKAFTDLAAVRATLADMDEQKRGRLAVVTPSLKGIGAAGLLPLLQEIALDAKPKGSLPDEAWRAWKLGLLEAAGSLRDARSAPVLEAILDGSEPDSSVLEAAGKAYGKLGTDAVVKKLGALAKGTGNKRLAALAGLGHCRRTASAKLLVAELDVLPKSDVAKVVAKALGNVGSGAAWKALQRTGQGVVLTEEAAVRKAALESLVRAYVPYGGEVRELLQKAILVVDHDDTPTVIANARKNATKDGRIALDELLAKFQASPLRKH